MLYLLSKSRKREDEDRRTRKEVHSIVEDDPGEEDDMDEDEREIGRSHT
jgi:hypothetical protein